MAWQTPKTDWSGNNYFRATDWNRIDGNVEYIATALSLPYTTKSVSNGDILTAGDRNNVTDTLDLIYAALQASWSRTIVARRVDYGSAWDSKDLNAIETFLLNAKAQIDGQISDAVVYYAGSEIYCGDSISVGLL